MEAYASDLRVHNHCRMEFYEPLFQHCCRDWMCQGLGWKFHFSHPVVFCGEESSISQMWHDELLHRYSSRKRKKWNSFYLGWLTINSWIQVCNALMTLDPKLAKDKCSAGCPPIFVSSLKLTIFLWYHNNHGVVLVYHSRKHLLEIEVLLSWLKGCQWSLLPHHMCF